MSRVFRKTKYTPGPWRVSIRDSGGSGSGFPSIHRDNENGGDDPVIIFTEGFAVNDFTFHYVNNKEILANAALIAAAPDLRECLPSWPHPSGKLLKIVAHYEDGSTETIHGDIIVSAIEKADNVY